MHNFNFRDDVRVLRDVVQHFYSLRSSRTSERSSLNATARLTVSSAQSSVARASTMSCKCRYEPWRAVGVDGRAGTILLSRREYNPPEALRGGGDWQKASIDPSADLRLIGVFYRAARASERGSAGGRSIYTARPDHHHGRHHHPCTYQSSIKQRFNTNRFMVVTRRSTKSSSPTAARRGPLTVTALSVRCCPSVRQRLQRQLRPARPRVASTQTRFLP